MLAAGRRARLESGAARTSRGRRRPRPRVRRKPARRRIRRVRPNAWPPRSEVARQEAAPASLRPRPAGAESRRGQEAQKLDQNLPEGPPEGLAEGLSHAGSHGTAFARSGCRAVHRYLGELHDRITSAVESIDAANFAATRATPGRRRRREPHPERRPVSREPASRSPTCSATSCRTPRPRAGLKSPARDSRRWGCRWYSTRVIPTCRPRIATCVFCSRLPNKDRRCGGSEAGST